MRGTGERISRHRSVFLLLAVATLLLSLATPTWPGAAPRHTDRVAVLAQQPLPHCAVASVPVVLPPGCPEPPPLRPALDAPRVASWVTRPGVPSHVSARDPPVS
ncbi:MULTISPECIES: hypothetical protein [Amycolatopsis]|uniref:Uncharacterized protein n=2 Tax=Amycolatopsis TaxID=1813 RepID=A0A1I3KDY8_9PSEU|nr:hypothetical protein [Amycolatopsis sacchari]SFI70604.1 hypothetical protein SAMN05421835_101517 [Amycolatopsis sacchari]